MRTLILGGFVSCLLLGSISIVRADEEKSPAADPSAAVAQPSAAAASPAKQEDAWRYKRHDGRWWYWLPSEKWVYWSDGKWVDYDPATYRSARAANRRVYSYGGSNSGNRYLNGFWGPVYRNSYGDVQYPYSRRKTGIRQLGPVPAMGGVRALPGWGGER